MPGGVGGLLSDGESYPDWANINIKKKIIFEVLK
jgi:hypothetical protein